MVAIQEFNFDIEYRQGKYIQYVDYFSRNPVNNNFQSCATVNAISIDNWLKKAQGGC